MCVHIYIIYIAILAGLKSKKQQLEHNQRQLQEKIGHAVTGIVLCDNHTAVPVQHIIARTILRT